jgi:hypothetical protein
MLSDIQTTYANSILDAMSGQYLGALKQDLTEVGTAVSGAPSSSQYNRAALTLNTAASKRATNNGALSITMPSGLTADTKVPYVGVYSAQTAGTLRWILPATVSKFEALVDTANLFTTGEAHGFSADDRVIFDDAGTALPTGTGFALWQVPTNPYFVLSSGLTSTAFKIATTSGGSEIDITVAGGVIVRKINVQGFNGSQVLQIADTALTLAFG